MADFIFRVDSVQLSEAQRKKIASAIQGTVLTELAKLDLQEEPKDKAAAPAVSGLGGSFLYNPLKWYGGLLLKAVDVNMAASSVFTVINKGEQSQSAA